MKPSKTIESRKSKRATKKPSAVAAAPTGYVAGRPQITPRLQQTMTRAAIEAAKMEATYIGTEHVLLAILALQQGSAWRMLMACGMTYESTKFALRVQQCS